MGKIVTCLVFDLILFSLVQCISSSPTGFSLKLIHRHSPLSPFYQPNMSVFERFKSDVEISMNRNIYFQEYFPPTRWSLNATIHKYPLLSPIHYFTVEVGIGNPVVRKTLVFYLSSSYTWIQCKPCLNCFRQDRPLFDIKKSSSYKKVSPISPFSSSFRKLFHCTCTKCSFHQRYPSGYLVSGVAAMEKFTFQTATSGVPYKTNHLGFGCGTKMNINYFPPTINGVLGFDRARSSFARQLQTYIKSRFSYCVPPTNTTKGYSYLKFGDEAIMRNKNTQSAPLEVICSFSNYKVQAFGFSINGDRLGGIKVGHFSRYAIDTNTPFTNLDELFVIVERKLGNHFAKFGVSRVRPNLPLGMGSLPCCYSHPSGFTNFPDMTFHFIASDFHIPPENLFIQVPQSNISCLAMVPGCKHINIFTCELFLGVYQQQNKRFIFDLKKNEVSFATEKC